MTIDELFVFLLNNSITAGWVILAVLLLRLLLKKAPRRYSCLLWTLPALRLALPFSVESVLSLIPSAETLPREILTDAAPAISSNLPAVDAAVNPVLQQAFTPVATASANPLQIWLSAAGLVWLAGTALMLLLCLVSALRLRRSLRFAVHEEGEIWRCESVASPFVFGLFKPRIYLPFQLKNKELDYVMAHEREHIRRGDHWAKLLAYLILSVYWFNPLVWLAYVLLSRDMEFACDEAVIGLLDGAERKDYSLALLGCADRRHAVILCPPAFGEVGVKERIKKVMKYKRPALIISIAAVLLLAVAALCLLTNPKTEPAAENPGVYLRLNMDKVYQLAVVYNSGSGGCVNADNTPFAPEEYIWLDLPDGIEGTQEIAVIALGADGENLGERRWTIDIEPEKRIELDWASGEEAPLISEPGEGSLGEPTGEERDRIIALAQRELDKWYELGILSQRIDLGPGNLQVLINETETDLGGDFFGREVLPYYNVSNKEGSVFATINIDMETEKIMFASLSAYGQDGDEPLADREPMSFDGKTYYYYDKFSAVFPEDITVDQLCQRLNEYWGFDGYTLSGTKFEMYDYDTQAPEGSQALKEFMDAPFITVYFDGDQEGVPMYVEIVNFPGNTHIDIGTNHLVG